MADQRKITLRPFHATAKNIIVRELPVATPSAGTRIYLYPFHATAKNIILRDPATTAGPGGPVDADFVGAAAIIFGQTGDLTASSALISSTLMTFDLLGALNGASSFSGTTTITFGTSGTFGAYAGFSGTVGMVFGASGGFGAGSSLSGTSAVTFGLSGDFVAGVGAGDADFSGTAAMSFGLSGDFISGPTPIIIDMDMHDGRKRGPSTQEIREENYVRNKRAIADLLDRHMNGNAPEPEIVSVEPEKPVKTLPESITRLLRERSAPEPIRAVIAVPHIDDEDDDLAMLLSIELL
jgi:hypothetical protein